MPEISLPTEIQFVKGVGPRRAEALAMVGIRTVADLLYYLPRRYLDRSVITPIGALRSETAVTVIGKVMGKGILKGKRQRLEVMLGDGTGYIALIWFSGIRFLEKYFSKGEIYAATGAVSYFQQLQMVHPEMERMEDDDSELIHAGRIVPVYPATSELKETGLTGRVMRRLVKQTLELCSERLPEPLPRALVQEHGLAPFDRAIRSIHFPESAGDIETARKRLAFDELLELQYLILRMRKKIRSAGKMEKYQPPGNLLGRFVKQLPFQLTEDQNKAINVIVADMQKERPMHRLLQGDVGCGKTVVALAASVFAAENGYQAAFMAPTELLAEQHYRNWAEFLNRIGIKAGLLTGSLPGAEKKEAHRAVASGEAQIVFGTHALLSEPVKFSRLSLVIIDEQHRFGVMQRGNLVGKGRHPDTLVMSATPIPRTLALTLYGDLDLTTIRSMPPGRKPTRTVWRNAAARPEIYKFLKEQLKTGRQIFFIYPLVEKSEKVDLQAAEEEYERLKKDIFPEFRLGLVHGRIKREQREKAIADFRSGRLQVLVATTVIEVGIDIPSASIMVIEHAERFGLSQLHQLRGRVGRGTEAGLVIAIATPPISDMAKERLELFQSSGDGFEIAEADLRLRGPGEFFGTRQHGLPELRIANLSKDDDLLPITRHIVTELLSDKGLDSERQNLLGYLTKKTSLKKYNLQTG